MAKGRTWSWRPRNWFGIERIYGRDGEHETVYLTRIVLTPMTRWGQLYFHIFHRGDQDPDPHDHPWDFWTFPLSTYLEMQMMRNGLMTLGAVMAWRWTFRPAEYSHLVVGVANKGEEGGMVAEGKKLMTFVWRRPERRQWGFWVREDPDVAHNFRRVWVHWRDYLYGDGPESQEARGEYSA